MAWSTDGAQPRLPARPGGSLGAGWCQVGTATSPAGPCPTACPSTGLARGLKPRLSRGMPKAVSFASNVCSMSSCACERRAPRSARSPAPARPLRAWATGSLHPAARGRGGTPNMPSFAGRTGETAAGREGAQLARCEFPSLGSVQGSEQKVPFPTPRSHSRHSAAPSAELGGGGQGSPSPFPHLADPGQLELQVLDGGVLGIEHVLQRETGHQATAVRPRGPPPCPFRASTAQEQPAPGRGEGQGPPGSTPQAPAQPRHHRLPRCEKRATAAPAPAAPPCRCGTRGITGKEASREDAGGS